MITEETKKWCAKEFGIPESDVIWYNSGICYSRIGVLTKESAKKVFQKVNGQTVNGGMFHGMPLGSSRESKREDGTIYYDVTC